MPTATFTEGVKPGGLTTGTELRILLCYLLSSTPPPVTREQLEEALLGEELVNYFVLAEGLAQLEKQQLVTRQGAEYRLTPKGETVAHTLAQDVPRSVRETAVRAVVRAQQYAAKRAAHRAEVTKGEHGRQVRCTLVDETASLFNMELYMPDELSAEMVRAQFVQRGDEVYKLVLAALTQNKQAASEALEKLGTPQDDE